MTVVTITAGVASPWTLPGDWPGTADVVECIGAGAGGTSHRFVIGGSTGGGGGAYARVSNVTILVNPVFQLGVGGAGETVGGAAAHGTATFFGNALSALAIVAAAPGKKRATDTAGDMTGGLGGKTVSCIGTTIFAGGNGGNSGRTIGPAGGGGGAGFSTAAGSNGTNATNSATAVGGAGGNSFGLGGAGGLATLSCTGVSAVTNLLGGGGGGGGGSGKNVASTPSANGGFGAAAGGGGGGGGANVTVGSNGGGGGGGVILVTYTPAAGPAVVLRTFNLLGVGM